MGKSSTITGLESRLGIAICSVFVVSYFLSFEIGTFFSLRVRLEEAASVLVLMYLFYFGATKRVVTAIPPRLLIPFFTIYVYSLLITLIDWIFSSWHLTGLIYLIRDIQYFAVGLLFFFVLSRRHHGDGRHFNAIDKTIIISVCLNISWSIYQLLSRDFRGHYATAAIGLDGSSAASGIAYYACLVLTAFLYARTERKSLVLLIFLSFVGILLTSNRTFSVAGLLFLLIWGSLFYWHVFARLWRKGVMRKAALLLPSLILPVVIILFLLPQSLLTRHSFYNDLTSRHGVISRFSRIEDGVKKRYDLVALETEEIRKTFLSFVLGNGKGHYEQQYGRLKMGMHSQFSRLTNEIGILGILMWCCFFCFLVITVSQNGFLPPPLSRVATSFLISFFSTFFSYDVLLISKSAFLFWIFIFLIFAHSNRRSAVAATKLKGQPLKAQ